MCSINLLNLCAKNIELNTILNDNDLTVADNLCCNCVNCSVLNCISACSKVSFCQVNGNLAILFAVSQVSLMEGGLGKADYFVGPVAG